MEDIRIMKYYKSEEGKINQLILSVGVIGILIASLLRERLGEPFFTIMISISTSVVASAVVAFVMAAYLYKRNSRIELIEKWGIASITESRGIINSEVNELFEKNVSSLDIIAFGLKSFREAREDRVRKLLEKGMTMRIITVNPNSSLLAFKDIDENKLEGSTQDSIKNLNEWCNKMNNSGKGTIEIRYINTLPTEVYFRVDNNIFVGPYQIGRESQQTITMRYEGNTDGVAYYKEYFEKLWEASNKTFPTSKTI